MHIGDRLYHISGTGNLQTLIIISISEELDKISFEVTESGKKLDPLSLYLSDIKLKYNKEYFDSPGDALKYKDKCIANFYDRVLREALNCIQLDEVVSKGKELKSSRVFDYPGKNTKTATLYEYKEKLYVVVKELDIYSNESRCILFREVEKGVNA